MPEQPDRVSIDWRERQDDDVDPRPEPDQEPVDPHQPPLDDDEDGRFLPPMDPRRLEAEKRRGQPFESAEQDREATPEEAARDRALLEQEDET
jgi:hypothetical protein